MSRKRNKKYSRELKIRAVKAYLGGEWSQAEICEKYEIPSSRRLCDWINSYLKPLMKLFAITPDAHLLFHSDRVFQYTSKTFHNKLIQVGMSQVVRCIDNGHMMRKKIPPCFSAGWNSMKIFFVFTLNIFL